MDFSAKLTLPYVLPNQAQKHVTMNESLRRLDALVQISVISISETTPPNAPTDGDRFIPATNSVGEWDGADGKIAAFQDGAWMIYPPQIGWLAWIEAEAVLRVFDGEGWVSATANAALKQLAINAPSDDFNRLSVSADASLFNHDGAGHQLKINKSQGSDTASLLLQTGFEGRAEIGLAGSDDLLIKTSADGQSFQTAISVENETGHVGIGKRSPESALDVAGIIKVGSFVIDHLPNPSTVGAGAIAFVSDAPSGGLIAFCDGADWRSLVDRSVLVSG